MYSYGKNNPIQKYDPFGLCEGQCFPTGFDFKSEKDKTILTDWILYAAYEEGATWEDANLAFSRLRCKWKRKVQITRTFSITTKYFCIVNCP